jgi:hypothetical protein
MYSFSKIFDFLKFCQRNNVLIYPVITALQHSFLGLELSKHIKETRNLVTQCIVLFCSTFDKEAF